MGLFRRRGPIIAFLLLFPPQSVIMNELKLGLVVGVWNTNDGIAVTTKEDSEFLYYCAY
jgi:hypothetical protein